MWPVHLSTRTPSWFGKVIIISLVYKCNLGARWVHVFQKYFSFEREKTIMGYVCWADAILFVVLNFGWKVIGTVAKGFINIDKFSLLSSILLFSSVFTAISFPTQVIFDLPDIVLPSSVEPILTLDLSFYCLFV